MPSEPKQRDAQIAHVIERGRSFDLAKLAAERRGFGDSDGGFGIIYPHDLDHSDAQQGPIPDGYVEVYGYWGSAKGGFEFFVTEREYLTALATSLRAMGKGSDAAAVERLVE